MAMRKAAALAVAALAASWPSVRAEEAVSAALAVEDECASPADGACALNALSVHTAKLSADHVDEPKEPADEIVEDYGDESDEPLGEHDVKVEDWQNGTKGALDDLPAQQLPVFFAGRRDVTGIEACGGKNVKYCNSMMYRARGACGGSHCVLIVNPPGYRTRVPLHIHAYPYNGHGASVKAQMSKQVCGKGGWHTGGFPCGGRAKFFKGFPPVFSVVGGNPLACVTAWPGSCGGSGTIVLVSYGCSIEHSISQR